MAEIPEHLLQRTAEARAKALGVPVEQVLAELRGEAPPAAPEKKAPEKKAAEKKAAEPKAAKPEPEPAVIAEPSPKPAAAEAATGETLSGDELLARAVEQAGIPENLVKRSAEAKARALGVPVEQVLAEMAGVEAPAAPVAEATPAEPVPAEPAPAPPAEAPTPAAAPVGMTAAQMASAASERAGIPETLVMRSAEAKAKAQGVPVEQVLAEMAGVEAPAAAAAPPAEPALSETPAETAPAPPAAAVPVGMSADELLAMAAERAGIPESLMMRSAEAKAKSLRVPVEQVLAEMAGVEVPAAAPAAATAPPAEPAVSEPAPQPAAAEAPTVPAADTEAPAAQVIVEEPPVGGNGHAGNGSKVAATVSPRPVAPPAHAPEGIRTQRLLTVVKARAIQQVKAEPTDKVNTWPHLMLVEFVALLAMTGLLLIMSTALQAPLLDPANPNATPNPSKAPWYFLGLQELLSYFDPQIAGVTVPTIIGIVGFMMIPYVDRNPSTKPSDRKFAIMLYTIFLTGSATLTILGVLFRGRGFNFSYPWKDGIFFDDLKDWVNFE